MIRAGAAPADRPSARSTSALRRSTRFMAAGRERRKRSRFRKWRKRCRVCQNPAKLWTRQSLLLRKVLGSLRIRQRVCPGRESNLDCRTPQARQRPTKFPAEIQAFDPAHLFPYWLRSIVTNLPLIFRPRRRHYQCQLPSAAHQVRSQLITAKPRIECVRIASAPRMSLERKQRARREDHAGLRPRIQVCYRNRRLKANYGSARNNGARKACAASCLRYRWNRTRNPVASACPSMVRREFRANHDAAATKTVRPYPFGSRRTRSPMMFR